MDSALHDEPISRLPGNLEAERALLGALIFDNRQIDEVLTVLPPEPIRTAQAKLEGTVRPRRGVPQPEPLFLSAAHELIFGAVCRMQARGTAIDLTLLGEELMGCGQLEAAGGAANLGSLIEDVFLPHQARHYAEIVEQKWRLRCLIRACNEIQSEALHSGETATKLIELAEQRIFSIADDRARADFVPVGEEAQRQLTEVEELIKHGVRPGLPTGFHNLDKLTAGLHAGNMVILAARPRIGKTALAINMATHIALRHARPVAIFSLEMTAAEVTKRIMCTLSGVPNTAIRDGRLNRDATEKLREAAEQLRNAPLHIDDSSGITVLDLRARARRLAQRWRDLSLIVIDYLQLMSGTGRHESRQQEVSEISRSLKSLAKELKIPILALSQLSRQSEQRRGKEKEPRLSDLRESGAIEQDADVVMFIDRRAEANENSEQQSPGEPAELIVAKNRHGPAGRVKVIYYGPYFDFREQDTFSD